ncbi:MAG: OmpA family protein [Chitinophagaceae bacterium]|nr:OmpA family protein [Chitinophagaceae bacterium]MBL0202606.1 OmpA family protein [Chitinophagaceae bacterium]
MKYIFIALMLFPIFLISCVSSKKLKTAQENYNQLQAKYAQLQRDNSNCLDVKTELARQKSTLESDNSGLSKQIADLNKQIDFMKANNTTVLQQLQNLSVVSGTQAESIKRSLETIGYKDSYIQDLQSAMARKDSLNLALVMNLKGAIGNLNDEDINIKVDKGVVYIDISDKLLFKSGKYDVTPEAKIVLGKVAAVLKSQPEIEFLVEGHTDAVPYHNALLLDNWDLSVKRATSVVRILQNQYGLDPAKMTAAGRGEYNPVAANNASGSNAANRRTRIVILPQLDQFFKLLEPKKF